MDEVPGQVKFPLCHERAGRCVGIGSSGSASAATSHFVCPTAGHRADSLGGESRGRDPENESVRKLAGFRPGRLGGEGVPTAPLPAV